MGQSYLLRRDGRDYQAQDLDTMRQWARDGRVLPSDMVYSPRYQSWYRARDLRELRDVLPNVDAPPPAAPPPAVRPPQQFWLRKGDQNYAADGLDTILRWASEGNISPDDFIYHPAYGKWFRAGDSPQLANRFPDHIKRALPFLPPGDDPMRSATSGPTLSQPLAPTQAHPAAQPPVDPPTQAPSTTGSTIEPQLSEELSVDDVESADSMARTVMDFKAADLQRALAAREADIARKNAADSASDAAAPKTGAGGGVKRVEPTASSGRLSASRPTPAPIFHPEPQILPQEGLDSVDEPTRPIDGPLGKPRPSGAAVIKSRRTGRFTGESKAAQVAVRASAPAVPAPPAVPDPPAPADSVEMLDPEMVEEVPSLAPVARPPAPPPEPEAKVETPSVPAPTPSLPTQSASAPVPEAPAASVAAPTDPEPEPAREPEPAADAPVDPNARYVDRLGLMKLFYDVARVFVVTKDIRPGELLEASCKLASTGDEFLGQAKRAIYHKLAMRMKEHMDAKVRASASQIQPNNMPGYRLFLHRAGELIRCFELADEHVGRKPPERVVIGNAARPKLTPLEEEAIIRIDSALKALISIRQKASEAA